MATFGKTVLVLACALIASSSAAWPQQSPAASPPEASPPRADSANIEQVKSLDARGTYMHLVGNSLFLNPGTVLGKVKQVPPEMKGGWFDIAENPASPRLLASSLPAAWDVVVVGDHAITCNYEKCLVVYRLHDHVWQKVARLDLPSMAENIVVRGKLAYVATHVAGMTVVDIADPARPAIVGALNPNIDCDAVGLWQQSAVLGGHHEGQIVLADISDPARPRQTGVCQLPKILNGGELEVSAGMAYITSRKGLFIVDITDCSQPSLVQAVDLNEVVHDVIVQDGYAFLAADRRGVRVYDVRNPRAPVEVGHYQAGPDFCPSALAVTKSPDTARNDYYLYVADMNGPASVLVFHAGHVSRPAPGQAKSKPR